MHKLCYLNYLISFVRGWTGWFLLTKSSRISIFNKSDILDNVCKSGWVVFVHHFEMVTGSLPSCSANHLLVWPASASTALSLFKFSMDNKIKFWCKFNKLPRNNHQCPENLHQINKKSLISSNTTSYYTFSQKTRIVSHCYPLFLIILEWWLTWPSSAFQKISFPSL